LGSRYGALGFFNSMSGLKMLIASVGAGELWDGIGAAETSTPVRVSRKTESRLAG